MEFSCKYHEIILRNVRCVNGNIHVTLHAALHRSCAAKYDQTINAVIAFCKSNCNLRSLLFCRKNIFQSLISPNNQREYALFFTKNPPLIKVFQHHEGMMCIRQVNRKRLTCLSIFFLANQLPVSKYLRMASTLVWNWFFLASYADVRPVVWSASIIEISMS